MKITQVEPQKTLRLRSGQGPHRFNVFINGEFAFGADEDLVVEQRLVPGKIIDQTLLEKLIFEAEVGKLMERMYGLFNIRQRSEKEVRTYLKNLSFKRKVKDQEEISDLTINSLIEKLKQKRLLDDKQFAKDWVEARRKSKQKGIRVIKAELLQKGIDKEIIEEVISDKREEISEEELAKQALEKKMRVWKNLSPLEFKRKAMEFLMRRGFEYEVVKKVTTEIPL